MGILVTVNWKNRNICDCLMEKYEYLWLLNKKMGISVTVEWKDWNICDCWMEK
jgi:hypothetical protein